MKKVIGVTLLVLVIFGIASWVFLGEKPSPVTPDGSLQRLMDGNNRYVNNHPFYPSDMAQRPVTSDKQEPFAVILGCSDSRVAPEIIFDQGLGELFVVRVAGNVAGPIELDSIEFAASKLKTPLIMVLGHENCGAVNAVVNNQVDSNEIADIAPLIQPAVEKSKGMPGDRLTNAIKTNVELVVETLSANSILAKLISEKKLHIVGAYYDIDSSKVSLLEQKTLDQRNQPVIERGNTTP